MTVLSITRLNDEDTRLESSHNAETDKKCFEVLAKVVVAAMSEEDTKKSVLINCMAGMNRSAALACLVLSKINGRPFNDAVEHIERIRDEAARAGKVVPRGYFLSSGGAYFRDLFDSSPQRISRSKKRRQALTASKHLSSKKGDIGPSYDNKQHSYFLEFLELGKCKLHIGNLLAVNHSGFDFVVDLSGKAKTYDTIKMAFHECEDAQALISKLIL